MKQTIALPNLKRTSKKEYEELLKNALKEIENKKQVIDGLKKYIMEINNEREKLQNVIDKCKKIMKSEASLFVNTDR